MSYECDRDNIYMWIWHTHTHQSVWAECVWCVTRSVSMSKIQWPFLFFRSVALRLGFLFFSFVVFARGQKHSASSQLNRAKNLAQISPLDNGNGIWKCRNIGNSGRACDAHLRTIVIYISYCLTRALDSLYSLLFKRTKKNCHLVGSHRPSIRNLWRKGNSCRRRKVPLSWA